MQNEIFYLKNRRQQLANAMKQNSVLVLVAPEPSVRNNDSYYPFRTSSDLLYLTGINEDSFALVLTSQNECFIYCLDKDPERERWQGPVLGRQRVAQRLAIPLENVREYSRFYKELASHLKNKITLYYDFGGDTQRDLQFIGEVTRLNRMGRKGDFGPDTLAHVSQLLHEQRLFKDEFELQMMQKAGDVSADAHNKLMQMTRTYKNGVDEAVIKAFIEAEFRKNAADALAYSSITAAGANATILHYEKMSGFAKPDQLVLVDAACEWAGYASDITRTFPAGGCFTALQKDLYSIVLEAQEKAIACCKPGNSFNDPHEAAVKVLTQGLWDHGLLRKVPKKEGTTVTYEAPASVSEAIEKEHYRVYYMHKTSHFLGLDVHDVGAYYINGVSRALQSRMVLTVEPGLYFPSEYEFIPDKYKGIGIRIEDDIVITEGSPKVITSKCVKTIQEIEGL